MKRIGLILTAILVCSTCAYGIAHDHEYYYQHRTTALSGNRSVDPIYLFMQDVVGSLVLSGATGNHWYVDSEVDYEGDGKSWTGAKDTLDEAIDCLTSTDCNDVIHIAPNSTFAMGAAADEVDIDVSNVIIYGHGHGRSMPVFDYSGGITSGAFAIGADNVTIYNVRFHANLPEVSDALELEAGSTGVTLINCIFSVETAGTDEFHECISSDSAGNHYLRVIGCEFYMDAGAARSGIEFRDCDYAEIAYNYFAGDYAIADVNNASTASDHIRIHHNTIFNGTKGGAAGLNAQPCIELFATTSGVIEDNKLYCNVATPDAAVVGADMYLANNWYSETEAGVSAVPMWLSTDTALNPFGVDDADNVYSSDNVAANDAGTILERLEQIDVDTSAIVTDTAAMDTQAKMTALVDPNYITYDAARITTDTTSAMEGGDYQAADDPVIFTVTGDILCRAFAYATTQVTSTSNDTMELGITGDTACLLVQDVVDGTAFDVNFCWTIDQPPDTTSAELDTNWVFIPGGLDILLTINDNDITAGVMVFYLQWIPLSADAAVVGAAP